VGFEPDGYLRHGRVAWLVVADPDEAATAGDLEGALGRVDRVSDIQRSRFPGPRERKRVHRSALLDRASLKHGERALEYGLCVCGEDPVWMGPLLNGASLNRA
jgi:hypothetical protein